MNKNHYPAGTKKGGQFAPNNVANALGLNEKDVLQDEYGLDEKIIEKQRKIDDSIVLEDKKLLPLDNYSPEIQKSAIDLFNMASKNEPDITQDVMQVAKLLSGEIIGLENKFKTKESIAHKIQENIDYWKNDFDTAIRNTDDSLRYTMLFKPKNMTKSIENVIGSLQELGYKVNWVNNRYVGKYNSGYRDVNFKMLSPNGQTFEIQFMTEQVYGIKNGLEKDTSNNWIKRKDGLRPSHDYYTMEKMVKSKKVLTKEDEERLRYLQYMSKLLFSGVEKPQDIETIVREKYI